MLYYVIVTNVYLNGTTPVVDCHDGVGNMWRSVRVLSPGSGSANAYGHFVSLAAAGRTYGVMATGPQNNPWRLILGMFPAGTLQDVFSGDLEEPQIGAAVPVKSGPKDWVHINGGSLFKIDEFGNAVLDSRVSGQPIRFQVGGAGRVQFILADADEDNPGNITEGTLLANRTVTYVNDELVAKVNKLNTEVTLLRDALRQVQVIMATLAGAPATGQAVAAALAARLEPTLLPMVLLDADEATDDLTSAIIKLSDVSVPEVQDTASVNFGDE